MTTDSNQQPEPPQERRSLLDRLPILQPDVPTETPEAEVPPPPTVVPEVVERVIEEPVAVSPPRPQERPSGVTAPPLPQAAPSPPPSRKRSFFGEPVTTLSIDGASLSVVSSNRGMVESWYTAEFDSTRFFREGYIYDPRGLGTFIGDLLREKGFSPKHIVCALPGIGCEFNTVTIPTMKKVSVEKMMNLELKKVMTTPVEETHVTWHVFPDRMGKRRAFVVAVPNGIIESWVEACHAAGGTLHGMDMRILALARAINRKDGIIVHRGGNWVEIAIVVNFVPALVRCLSLGDQYMEPEMATTHVLNQASFTINFYAGGSAGGDPLPDDAPVYLTGDLATDPEVADSIAGYIDHPVGAIQPPLVYPPNLPLEQYLVNIGLVLKKT